LPYGFTEAELDFILNCKYRLGRDTETSDD
jgi:hypothetical protein